MLAVICVSQSLLFHKAVSESHFFATLRKSPSPDLFVFLNDAGMS